MVQKTFGIYSEDLNGSSLYIETGSDYLACSCKERNTGKVAAFELFSFDKTEPENFEKLFREVQLHSRLLTTAFDDVHCIWGYEQCVCVPNEFYSRGLAATSMELMYGEIQSQTVCENVIGDCVVATVINEEALAVYRKHYYVSSNMHKYYPLLKRQKLFDDDNKMHLVFNNNNFIASVYKRGALQLIQYFSYKAPEDALYFILQLAKTFALPAAETKIYASGLIDDSSPLYAILNAYLDNFSFEPANAESFTANDFNEYPLHYFVSFCQNDV